MKLHEALRELCRKHGSIIVQKKNLVYLLSDLGAFEELPGMREVMKALVSGGFAKDLYAWSLRKGRDSYLAHAEVVRKSLAAKGHFREEEARFAADSVSFAFGFADSVREPHAGEDGPGPEDGSGTGGDSVPVTVPKPGRRIEFLRRKAESGSDDAQYRLGMLCLEGGDGAGALRWLRRSAEQGNAMAQTGIAVMYMEGSGVAQDYEEAMRWFRKAAGHGNSAAEGSIGNLYHFGLGVSRDMEEAVRWYRKAAVHGNSPAANNLGVLYRTGDGPRQSTPAAACMRPVRESRRAGGRRPRGSGRPRCAARTPPSSTWGSCTITAPASGRIMRRQ